MKLMRLTLAAAAGGMAANYLLKKARASSGAAGGEDASSWPDGAHATSDSSTSTASSGGAGGSSASAFESPNAAERLRASRPANSLAGSGGASLDPLRSNARDGEYARSTGLSDFARGA